MCGIAGFMGPAPVQDHAGFYAVVDRMTGTLRHRGPDDGDSWVDAESGIGLGHRRLSIIDLSPEGRQPMLSPGRRFMIVFNGEIYNFLELRAELESHGVIFRGHSDTEVMLAAFEEWGVEASLTRFNGMFAFAVWDRVDRTLYLARDRFGKKPLYYGWQGNTFLFGSELKALRAHPHFNAPIDTGALGLYFRFGYIPSPHSIYRGISKLRPGTILAVRRASSPGSDETARAWWSAADAVRHAIEQPFRGSYAEAMDELEFLLKDAVRLRMIADVPLGAFLSGGIDSSLVVSMMQLQNQGPARTFSIGFDVKALNEAEHARAVARHLGSNHTELYATPEEALEVIPRLPEIYDEPFADSSQIPTYLVSWLTRRQVTVSLSGDGGDEFFGGYGVYFTNERFRRKYARFPLILRRAARKGLGMMSGFRAERLASAIAFETDAQIHRALVSQLEPSRILLNADEPPTPFDDRLPVSGFIERMMYLDTVTYLTDDILVKVDRASMSVALESRCPLLDYRVFEFAWRLPLEMKVSHGQGKRILRDLLYRHVPRHLVDRPKQGFGLPVSEWLRGPLRDWAEDLLSEHTLRQESILNPRVVRQVWERHLAGKDDATSGGVWGVLMFQAWLRSTRGRIAEAITG